MAEDNCHMCVKNCTHLVQCCKQQKRIQENHGNNNKHFASSEAIAHT